MTAKDSSESSFKPLDRLFKKLTVEILYVWILGLLTEEQKYAYQLRDEIKEHFGFTPAMVTSYAVLYKLEKDGFVVTAENTLFPNRKYYSITDKGKQLITETKAIFEERFQLLFGEQL